MLTDEGQKLNYRYNTYQGRVLICRRTFTVLDSNPNQGYRRFTLKPASTQESTILIEKVGSPKSPLQPLLKHAEPNHLAALGLLRQL